MPATITFTPAEVATLQADSQVQSLASTGDWSGLAGYLMEPGHTRPRSSITRGEMLRGLLPAVMRLPTKSDPEQRQWDRILGIVQATETVTLSDPGVQLLVGYGIQSGLLTQEEADRILLEPCTRIESLLDRAIPYVTTDDLAAVPGG